MGTEPKQLGLYLFEMNTISQYGVGEWRLPGDHRTEYTRLPFWTRTAKLLEEGRFDGIFLADVVGVHDVYRGDLSGAAEGGAQFPNNDPFVLAGAIAAVTEHLGIGVTASTSYSQPFDLARKFSTLDHLSDGRAGWNIVLSHTENSSRNFGLEHQLEHETRYAKAQDFLDAAFKLWEGSWDDDAVVADRAGGVYTHPDRVHYIDHEGPFFKVRGPHLSQPSLQRTPVLYQATASREGITFAGRNSEFLFTGGPTPASVPGSVALAREAAVAAGREPQDVRSIVIADVVVGRSEEEAYRKREELAEVVSLVGTFAKGDVPVDYLAFDPGTRLGEVLRRSGFDDDVIEAQGKKAPEAALAGSGKATQRLRAGQVLPPGFTAERTVAEVLDFYRASRRATFHAVGTPGQVVDEIESWIDEYGVDAINLRQHHAFRDLEDFVELVVPELQRRGRLRSDYAPETLRQRAFGGADGRLNERHPAAQYRHAFNAPTTA